MSIEGRFGFVEASGTHHDIGVRLGRFGAEIAHRHLVRTHAWASVLARGGDSAAARMRATVQSRFPAIWQELTGLAEGLGLPFDDVFLWNCRGDIWAGAPDGCTTVQVPGAPPVVAHNEDGDPGFRGHCAIARVRPVGGRAFAAFVYPASIPGHTFAVTETGLVQAVNNVRVREPGSGVPRMVLGRAVLDCATLDEALRLLDTSERAGGFHFTLAQRGDNRIFSVEFAHGGCSTELIEQPACHANHLLHSGMAGIRQVITASSRARQGRGDRILAAATAAGLDPLSLLRDRTDPALPVYRDQSDDPDHENTLATAVLRVGATAVSWAVFDRAEGPPRHVFRDIERDEAGHQAGAGRRAR
jgi:predicted choloylglycine hydrolase